MSRGVKIALVVVAVLLVLCCIGGIAAYFITQRVVSRAVSTNPVQATQTGHEIVDYTLPPGYHEVFAMNMGIIKMVAIGPQDESTDTMGLVLMQFPTGSNLSQEEMERQMSQALAQQGRGGFENMQVVGTQQVTIKGQTVTLTASEGSGSSGVVHRQVTGVFPGKDGLVMLMAFGAKDKWNQQALDEFLASIK